MRRVIQTVLLVLLGGSSIAVSGCASIVHGSGQEVSIASDPSGADVWVDNEKVGKTPVSPNLKRKRAHQVVVHKDGFKDEHRIIHRVLSGAVAGNILAGGFIGWGVDAVTGAQWRLVPETLHVELDPLPKGASTEVAQSPADRIHERLAAIREVAEAGGLTPEEASELRSAVTQELAGGAQTQAGEISPDERVTDLYRLLKQGLITDKEYATTKKSILAELKAPSSEGNNTGAAREAPHQ